MCIAKIAIVIPVVVAVIYAIRMLYYQFYEKKASYIIITIKDIEDYSKQDINYINLSKKSAFLLKGLEGVREYLIKCNNIKSLRSYNEFILRLLEDEIDTIKNKPDYMQILSLVSIRNLDLRNIWDFYLNEYKQKISNSRGAATLLGLLSTLLAIILR